MRERRRMHWTRDVRVGPGVMLRVRRAIGAGPDGWSWWPSTGSSYIFYQTSTASGWRVLERGTGRTREVCSLRQCAQTAHAWHEASVAEKKVLDTIAAAS